MTATLLIVSFSNISQDARVLKQVRLFRDRYRVITCGEGPAPEGVSEHIQLSAISASNGNGRLQALVFAYAFSLLQLLRLFAVAYRLAPQIREAERRLKELSFDAVLCNDIQPLPLLSRLIPLARVHADIHEYFPGVNDQEPRWRLLWQPYYRWMIRRFLPRVASMTTVTRTIAERYEQEFRLRGCEVVENAAPFQELRATEVGETIRIVHSGSALASRRIEDMMHAAAGTTCNVTLDLYLVVGEPEYHERLVRLAEALGDRITLHPPLAQQELVRALNDYDVGISVIPATSTNSALALPNKFFDYIQARLGIVINPSAEMERILAQEQLGLVTEDESAEAIRRSLDSLDRDSVVSWKANAERCARSYSAEVVSTAWAGAVDALLGTR